MEVEPSAPDLKIGKKVLRTLRRGSRRGRGRGGASPGAELRDDSVTRTSRRVGRTVPDKGQLRLDVVSPTPGRTRQNLEECRCRRESRSANTSGCSESRATMVLGIGPPTEQGHAFANRCDVVKVELPPDKKIGKSAFHKC